MTEPTYTIKEIMDIQFKGIDQKLDDIKATLREQNTQTEKRFSAIEKELDEIRVKQEAYSIQQAKYNTIWGIGATIGASLVAIFANKIF